MRRIIFRLLRRGIIILPTVVPMCTPIGDAIRAVVRPAMDKARQYVVEQTGSPADVLVGDHVTLWRLGKSAGLGFDRITVLSTFPAETEEGEELTFHLVDMEADSGRVRYH